MDTRLKSFIDTVINFSIGVWNEFGIFGILILMLLSPFAFAVVITFHVFRLGFKLFVLLIDEVNFYWHLWALATTVLLSLLIEFLNKKIFKTLVFLWQRLFNPEYAFNTIENKLSNKWITNLLICFLKQIFVFIGFLLIIITLSSLIYSVSTELSGNKIDVLTVWLLRFLLLTPLVHRYLRYKKSKKVFSWEPEKKDNSFRGVLYSSWIFVIITLAVLVFLVILNFYS